MAMKKDPQELNKRRSSAAPGQFYGYAVVQEARFLQHLLDGRDGDHVTLECLDDVSTEGNGKLTVEQDKSGLAHNPVSDRSIELWKTLYNWLEGLRDGSLPSGTKFVLYVAQDHSGDVVERLNTCKTKEDAANTIRWLRKEYWGEPPAFTHKFSNPNNLRKYLDPVLNAKDEVLSQILTQFELLKGNGAPYESIAAEMKRMAVGDNAEIDKVLNALIGWAKQRIAKCIEEGHKPLISYEDFHRTLLSYVRSYVRGDKELISFERTITDDEIKDQLNHGTYVKQLKIVGFEQDDLTDAVVEYLRACADRANWSLCGHVLEESFNQYQQELSKVWRRYKTANANEYNGSPEKIIGQNLYLRCMELRQRLQRMEVPDHFTPGNFHSLADDRSIGWHPRYNEILETNSTATRKEDDAK